MDFETVIIRKV